MFDKYLTKKKSDVEYLDYIPTLSPYFSDDSDRVKQIMPKIDIQKNHSFSKMNQSKLLEYFGKIKDKCRCIIEIGVHGPGQVYKNTSTSIFLNNKKDDTLYLGIDIDDKSFLNNKEKNIHTLKIDSSRINTIMGYLKDEGIKKIDFLFIDGWHSVNQVLKEIRLINYLSKIGIVGFHDVAFHPSLTVLDAISEKKFIKTKYVKFSKSKEGEIICHDNGIGFIQRK